MMATLWWPPNLVRHLKTFYPSFPVLTLLPSFLWPPRLVSETNLSFTGALPSPTKIGSDCRVLWSSSATIFVPSTSAHAKSIAPTGSRSSSSTCTNSGVLLSSRTRSAPRSVSSSLPPSTTSTSSSPGPSFRLGRSQSYSSSSWSSSMSSSSTLWWQTDSQTLMVSLYPWPTGKSTWGAFRL